MTDIIVSLKLTNVDLYVPLEEAVEDVYEAMMALDDIPSGVTLDLEMKDENGRILKTEHIVGQD